MIRKIIATIFIFILLGGYSFSQVRYNQQYLDSLFNLYMNLRGVSTSDKPQKQVEIDPVYRKCGMGLVAIIKDNFESFTLEQQTVLSKILQRPSLSNNIVSPSGFFKIHYATIGNDAISYDINLLAEALDSAYNFEVNYLGYPAPPSDGIEGGDGKYDVYVRNLGNLYGQTSSENQIGVSSWTSFMEMDNDFNGFYTQGINAARVTTAHEFHHAIQMGNYAPVSGNSSFRSSDLFFYEITSTSMEEFVYDDVNDYYAYMLDYFRNPERPFPLNNGYNLALWNIYLKNNFGFNILKRQWELMPNNLALKAIDLSINQVGSTLGNELNKFSIWTYFTNNRSIPGNYFKEAVNYPLIKPTAEVSFPNLSSKMYLGPVANYFLKINLLSSDGIFISIFTNSDFQKAIDNPNQVFDFAFSIFNDTISGERVLGESYSVSFSRGNEVFWYNAGILNNILIYGDSIYQVPNLIGETYAYPAPFKYATLNNISLAFESKKILKNEIDLNIYSVGMELIYVGKTSVNKSYLRDSKRYSEINWNVLDNKNHRLASGVYIYVIKSEDEIWKGKLVILHD